MIVIKDSDLGSLEEFPLKWRWTESQWNKLPVDALNSIRPFTQNKASELLQYSLSFSDAGGLFDSEFDQITTVDASTDSPNVRKWLRSCSADLSQRVIISWDNHHAALVDWDVFTEYWNDFCYPSSDDLAVWPLSNEWALMYLHSEVFVFGVRLDQIQENC